MKRLNLNPCLLVVLMIVTSIQTFAEDVIIDGIKYSCDAETGTATVSRGVDCRGAVTIPGSIYLDGRTYIVTGIGNSAFYNCKNITTIDFPESLSNIKARAFFGCSGLTSLEFHNSLKTIGESAFLGCNGLTSVYIPNSVTSIGVLAFYGCLNLESVEIGENVSVIGERAFKDTKVMNPIIHACTPPKIEYCEIEYWPGTEIPNDDFYGDPPFDKKAFEEGALYIPMESYRDYRQAYVWRNFKNMWPIGTSGIKDLTDADDAVTINGNTISVDAEAGTPVSIYSVDGVLRYQGVGPAEMELPVGTYIILYGTKTEKVIIH